MPKPAAAAKRVLDARPDTLDFRDRMYEPTLVEVPIERPLGEYRKTRVPMLDQGQEGACTGFGLAAVVHYLLRTRDVYPDNAEVSPRMLYEMAKRYDEWSGTDYEGSSARGAMKGWHKHGVCRVSLWPHVPGKKDSKLTNPRAGDGAARPLGAYFRVNHKDIVAMHAALAEVGILYATARVHDGWNDVDARSGEIPFRDGEIGGHAFAIVGYDRKGLWIQNSWGPKWGQGGFGRISYDDWLANGSDVWVARLGVPLELRRGTSVAAVRSDLASNAGALSQHELRPHVISLGNDGEFRKDGPFGTDAQDAEEILTQDFTRITGGWKKKRLLLYAHGGLVSETSAIQRVADYRQPLLDAEVYPLSFVWKTDYWTTLTNILKDAVAARRPEGAMGAAKDFLLDRVDDFLEPIARGLTGKASWDEMKENALLASQGGGALRRLSGRLRKLHDSGVELHVAAHSAGSILLGPLVKLLAGAGCSVATCTLWAPACTIELFKDCYLPAIGAGRLKSFALFALTDKVEQDDDCAGIYHKSLLYLVSNAFEERFRVPLLRPEGTPLLGMARFVEKDQALLALFKKKAHALVLSPNDEPVGSSRAARSTAHGAFDDDEATVKATLARILGRDQVAGPELHFIRSASSRRSLRQRMVDAR